MKTNLEKISNLERRLNIEVPLEKVTEAFEKIYNRIQQQVTLKGFRKGKAPIMTIKQMYKDHATRDVVEELVQKSYMKALEEHALDPINYPNIKIENLEESGPFKFTAEFEVRPDVALQQYMNLPVERELYTFDESQVTAAIDRMRTQRASLNPILIERPAQKGDFAVVDFEGRMNGVPVENATGSEHTLELGSGEFIPGFEEGIEGMKIGDTRTLTLKFPVEYHAPQLAGQPVEFQVVLKGLKKRDLPELNDEFVKTLGVESVDKLKELLREDIKNSDTKRIEEEFKNRLLKALVDRNPVDVPKSMLDDQKKLLIEDVRGRMEQQGMNKAQFEEYIQKWDDDFKKSATFMIQSSFLVNAIAAKESLRATEDDIEKRMEEYAKSAGMDISRLKSFYEKDDNQGRRSRRR